LQLLAPTTPESPIAAHLKRRGPGLFGVVIRVPDLSRTCARRAIVERVAQDGKPIDAGYAKEILLKPSGTSGALFVLREWAPGRDEQARH
ncbi:MAG TPA: hypothetical protein VGR43_02135, partial [Dehalococcoidia bacterium]|nr:hypothetical protein [Dehalococcoidia bacterium]